MVKQRNPTNDMHAAKAFIMDIVRRGGVHTARIGKRTLSRPFFKYNMLLLDRESSGSYGLYDFLKELQPDELWQALSLSDQIERNARPKVFVHEQEWLYHFAQQHEHRLAVETDVKSETESSSASQDFQYESTEDETTMFSTSTQVQMSPCSRSYASLNDEVEALQLTSQDRPSQRQQSSGFKGFDHEASAEMKDQLLVDEVDKEKLNGLAIYQEFLMLDGIDKSQVTMLHLADFLFLDDMFADVYRGKREQPLYKILAGFSPEMRSQALDKLRQTWRTYVQNFPVDQGVLERFDEHSRSLRHDASKTPVPVQS